MSNKHLIVLAIIILGVGVLWFANSKAKERELALNRQCAQDAQELVRREEVDMNDIFNNTPNPLTVPYDLVASGYNKKLNTCLAEYSYMFLLEDRTLRTYNIKDVYSDETLVTKEVEEGKVDFFNGREFGSTYEEAKAFLFK